MKNRKEFYKLIEKERQRQDKKWGEQNHKDPIWHIILAEEFGEISQNICSSIFDKKNKEQEKNLDIEIIQAAAVLVAWAESRKRNKK